MSSDFASDLEPFIERGTKDDLENEVFVSPAVSKRAPTLGEIEREVALYEAQTTNPQGTDFPLTNLLADDLDDYALTSNLASSPSNHETNFHHAYQPSETHISPGQTPYDPLQDQLAALDVSGSEHLDLAIQEELKLQKERKLRHEERMAALDRELAAREETRELGERQWLQSESQEKTKETTSTESRARMMVLVLFFASALVLAAFTYPTAAQISR